MSISWNAAPGSEAEARAIRAAEAYYEEMRTNKDNAGHDLYRQCAEAIVESGDTSKVASTNSLIWTLETALRGSVVGTSLGLGDLIVDLAAVLDIVPSYDAWSA